MDDTLLLWVDVETTGLDPSHGAILEIGMRWTDTRLDRLDGGFSTPVAYAGPVDGFIERMHGPNGLLAACARPGAPTSDEAARLARAYVASRLSDGVRVLAAGASVRFDRDWLDTRMPGVLSGVHHRSLDVSALDEAARMWAPLTWAARPERTTDHRVDSRLDDELRLAAYYRDAFRGGWRMWARLRGVLARVGRWFLSPAGRAVWVRLLLFGASIPLAPYMVAVWRVALYGQGAEQCLLFVAVAGVLLFRGGWRRLHALRAARDEDRQSDPDRARKPVRPARNRARRR